MNFYFDHNLPWTFAVALDAIEQARLQHNVYAVQNQFGNGIPDEELIPMISAGEGVLITRDLAIRKPIQFQLINEYQIGAIFVRPVKCATFWQLQRQIFKDWFEIRSAFEGKSLPLSYNLSPRGGLKICK